MLYAQVRSFIWDDAFSLGSLHVKRNLVSKDPVAKLVCFFFLLKSYRVNSVMMWDVFQDSCCAATLGYLL